MTKANKLAEQRARDVEKTRRLLKQFLYALHVSEGFGKKRLTRVLIVWSETYSRVKDPKNNENDEMLMIEEALSDVLPSRFIRAIGYEKLLDRKGNEIK